MVDSRGFEPTATRFAPAERATGEDLTRQISLACRHPITSAVLQCLGGIGVILNRERQIISFNDSPLAVRGIQEPEQLLGLRPGEALGCVHASETVGGCGTTLSCASCGAVIAILTSQAKDEIATQRGGEAPTPGRPGFGGGAHVRLDPGPAATRAGASHRSITCSSDRSLGRGKLPRCRSGC